MALLLLHHLHQPGRKCAEWTGSPFTRSHGIRGRGPAAPTERWRDGNQEQESGGIQPQATCTARLDFFETDQVLKPLPSKNQAFSVET